MNADVFFDSNVLLYLVSEDEPDKKIISRSLVRQGGFVSPQVLFECLNVSLRKYGLSKQASLEFVRYLQDGSLLQNENKEVVEKAFMIFDKYLLQPYDSKIVASALVAGCTTLYSEDMQHGLVIENTLTIINPFL